MDKKDRRNGKKSGNAENRYNPSKQVRFEISILRSDLCDFRDTYIVVKITITVTNPNNDAYDKKLVFKNNAPFVSCISKIKNTLIDNAEDLDIVIPMYSLLNTANSKHYSKTTGRLWNYDRDEPNGGANNNIKVLQENWKVRTKKKKPNLLCY